MVEIEISHYEQNNLYIVIVGSNLTTVTVTSFNQYLVPLLDNIDKLSSFKGIILDMKRVSFLDSSGIGVICGKFVRLKKAGKKLALCNVNKSVHDAFKISGLDGTLTFYKSIPEAVAILGTQEEISLPPSQDAKSLEQNKKGALSFDEFLIKKSQNFN